MFVVNDLSAMVLFDVGSSRLVVSHTFYAQFVIPRSHLSHMLYIEVVVQIFVLVKEKLDACSIVICSHTFSLTLILIGIKSFDVILGMD